MAGELQTYATQNLWRTQVRDRLGASSLSASAQTGFTSIPLVNGVPTATPTLGAGLAAFCVSVTDYRLYWFVGGSWRHT